MGLYTQVSAETTDTLALLNQTAEFLSLSKLL